MQGRRGLLDSLADTIDLNQGSVSTSNSNAMDHSSAWDNLLNPPENRLSNYMLSSGESTLDCTSNSTHNARKFSGWDAGESSSGGQDRMYTDLKIGQDFSTSVSSDAMQEDKPEQLDVNHVNRRAQNMSNSVWQGTSTRCYFPSREETHEGLPYGSSAKNLGASTSNSLCMMEENDEAGSSLGASGSSGKRKAFEGSSPQLYPGGSSSAHAQPENVTSPPICWPHSSTHPEQMDPRLSVGFRGTSSEIFPPSRISGVNVGYQDQDMFSFPLNDQPSRTFASSESSMVINSPYHAPGYSGSMVAYPWNGYFDSQSGTSPHPFMLSRERGNIFRDELNSRTNLRNNRDLPAEVTSLVQDSPSANIALGTSHSSRSFRSGSSSTMRNLPTGWTADQNVNEYAPWTLFPPVELDDGNQRGQFPITPPESSSSLEAEMLSFSSRRRQHQSSRSGLLMDPPSDAISSWRALAEDLEGRQRLIRQVRNAVRRRDIWRAQDFAVFGPLINGAGELHDRHSDMRLDVDSMSYEELLALEERIGNVSTGLNEEMIMKCMNQRKYQVTGSSFNDEPCCICREEYVGGDDIGTVACGHEFHTECIKQWLLLKNLCPICKMTALKT